ncbi:MAG: phosphatidylserine decarboxylase [Deltaproteobacteria bacterium]|nr:phosphatidylserine decarboxylase [Deltaproteobacteria bacterium]
MRYPLLSLLPKNLESYVLGKASRLAWPRAFTRVMNAALVKLLKIDMSEAAKRLDDYPSFEDLFTRALKEGARPIQGDLCSPCDSILRYSQPIDRGQGIQAKGLYYPVNELLFAGGPVDKTFRPSWLCSFYLAPHHYHRVHAPFSGFLHSVRYVPGELWPVNDTFVKVVPRLFCRNERVVFELTQKDGGKAYLVMVGALNVGRMKVNAVNFFETNNLSRQFSNRGPKNFPFAHPRNMEIGEELGMFMLGSSVIIVFDDILSKRFPFKRISQGLPIKMGEKLIAPVEKAS